MLGRHLLQLLLAALVLVGAACGSETGHAASRTVATVASTSPTTQAPESEPTTSTSGTPSTTAAPTTTAGTPTTTHATATTAPTPSTADAVVTGFPVTVAGVVIPEPLTAIISLSATATEVLFAVGAGDQVIAVDATSDYPAEAPVTDLNAFQPNVEAVAAYGPDLVVLSWDPGAVQTGLEALGIPVLIQPPASSISDAYLQMLQLGEATGHSLAAERLVASIQAEINDLVTGYSISDRSLSYYHEVDNTLYSATSSTFVGNVYSLFGLDNIANAADVEGFGYPQLSGEYILEADPDLIFFGCSLWCGTSAETIAERPGWSQLQAVRNGALVEVDDDISSRWGPRLIEFVRLIGEALAVLSGVDQP